MHDLTLKWAIPFNASINSMPHYPLYGQMVSNIGTLTEGGSPYVVGHLITSEDILNTAIVSISILHS